MKTLTILVFISLAVLAFGTSDEARYGTKYETYWSDTLESGSSDSLKEISIPGGVTRTVTLTMRQLDTNGVSSPDSVIFYNRIKTFYAEIDIKCCTDSVKRYIDFTYSSSGQIRSGYLFQPGLSGPAARMSNRVYRSNRRILIEATITY